MKSFFNKETSDGEYYIEQSELFEAVKQYLEKKSIFLNEQTFKQFDTFDGGDDASEFGLKIKFKYEQKNTNN